MTCLFGLTCNQDNYSMVKTTNLFFQCAALATQGYWIVSFTRKILSEKTGFV